MERKTTGTVTSVSTQWWLKINRIPVRLHSLDGASFPHIIKIRYTAGGENHILRKWIRAGVRPPDEGSTVTILYQEDRPSRARTVL